MWESTQVNPDEWCALVHVDIGMRTGLEVVEDALRSFVAGSASSSGVIELVALKDERRPNHFEVVGRFGSEAAYHEHQVAEPNLAFRRSIGPVLGSPYEDRLHGARGRQHWPGAKVGDFVVITQMEARPDRLDAATTRFDAFVSERSAGPGLLGQVALQRRYLPNNLEVVSVWSGPEAFDDHAGSSAASRAGLEEVLLAPIEDRRFELFAGSWATP
ncbi:MAG: antibiotic biosynthesis monooxygenase [Acidimicrobiales bacterium]|nr:antibiotic biosynthesis monooxygenase [Acidimicrobiales bacterium]